MKKFVVFLAFVLLVIGAASGIALFKSNSDCFMFKNDVFFVAQHNTLPFSAVLEGSATSNLLGQIIISPSDVITLTDTGFYGNQVGQCTVNFQTSSVTVIVKQQINYLLETYSFLPIIGYVGDIVELFEFSPTNLAYTIEANSLFAANAAEGTLSLLKAGSGLVTMYFQTENGSFLKRQIPITINSQTYATTIFAEQKLHSTLGQSFTLPYSIAPQGYNQSVVFASSNTTVATISDSGLISPRSVGSATITVKAMSGLNTWLEKTVFLHVNNPIEAFALNITNEHDNPFQHVMLAPSQFSHIINLQVVLPYQLENTSVNITSDATSLQTTALVAEGQTLKYALTVNATSTYTITVTILQIWANSSQTIKSQTETVAVQVEQEAFSALLMPLTQKVAAASITLHYEPSFLVQPDCAVASIQINKNFARSLNIQPLCNLIELIGNTIVAKGIGQAQLRVYDALGALPEQLLNITINALFISPLSTQTIAHTTYNDAPFEPIGLNIPQTCSQSQTTIDMQSKFGLFEIENEMLIGRAEGTDYLCFYAKNLLLLELPVILTRIQVAIVVENMLKHQTSTNENGNLAGVLLNCYDEVSLLVGIETTLATGLHYNLSIFDTNGTETTYASHGLLYGGADPREYNRISLITRQTTSFVLRIYVIEFPHIYTDVLITVQ